MYTKIIFNGFFKKHHEEENSDKVLIRSQPMPKEKEEKDGRNEGGPRGPRGPGRYS